MMNGETIELVEDLERGVIICYLNRANVHNAFNDVMIRELTSLFQYAENEDRIRLCVLAARGPSFSAGADLNWMSRMAKASEDENIQDAHHLARLFSLLNNFSKPIIGAVHGRALGGGVGLMSICDYVVATRSMTWGLTEVKLGLVPAVISPYVVAKIGESWARATFLSGTIFDAEKALTLHLVHELVDDEKTLTKRIESKVEEMLSVGPQAQREAKKLIRELVKQERSREREYYTCELIAKLRVSEEAQIRMQSIFKKQNSVKSESRNENKNESKNN